MDRRFVSIWFRHLATDWFSLRQPELKQQPFVLRTPSHGRMVITATNAIAEAQGITAGMALADARAIIPDLQVQDDKPDLVNRLLKRLAEWCIRFTPLVGVNHPDGILLDATGCSHLWGGDEPYIHAIIKKISERGYDVTASMADTIGAAWASARFGKHSMVIANGMHIQAMMNLPPEALRLEQDVADKLHKLGLHQIRQFINMPRASLRKRFGQHFMMRLDMALGQEIETFDPVQPIEPYQERLPAPEPIVTRNGIEIALHELLTKLCMRLQHEQKGIRTALFKAHRVDGKMEQIAIETSQPSHHIQHLFKLFEIKLSKIEPALGIELFVLESPKVEDHYPQQEKMWEGAKGLNDTRLYELIDKLSVRIGMRAILRYVPDEHYWPERSFKPAQNYHEHVTCSWRADKLRPLQLLKTPEQIEVAAPIPDYPPMLFIYKGKIHNIVKADGPERIEQEWWIQQGQHRDYYRVEDETGCRYWLFRLGHYHDKTYKWFIHGFFA